MSQADHAPAAGSKIVRAAESMVVRTSLVPTTPFLEPAVLPWVCDIEREWRSIRAELDEVLRRHDQLPNFQDIVPRQESLTNDDRWKSYFFVGLGHKATANRSRCPATAALLDEIPGLVTAFFSVLSPRKTIPPHRGPYRGLVRYHLGLRVPEQSERVGISVGGEIRHWSEGRSLLFDDGYEHQVWNDTDEIRVVLFADVVRPLRPPASLLNRALLRLMAHTPYARTARRHQKQWEDRFGRDTGVVAGLSQRNCQPESGPLSCS